MAQEIIGVLMTVNKALAFIKKHGVVLVSAKGPVPRMTEVISGEAIQGSWWAHPKSHQIYSVLEEVVASKDILRCRLIDGKVTLVHRRLWPALVRSAKHFSQESLAKVGEEHTAAGKHVSRKIAFPEWVPAEVSKLAAQLSEDEALEALGPWSQENATHPKSKSK